MNGDKEEKAHDRGTKRRDRGYRDLEGWCSSVVRIRQVDIIDPDSRI
jgi:hypothetical protein